MGRTAGTEPHCLYKGALYLLPSLGYNQDKCKIIEKKDKNVHFLVLCLWDPTVFFYRKL